MQFNNFGIIVSQVENHVVKRVFEKLSEAFKEDVNHTDIEKSLRSFR